VNRCERFELLLLDDGNGFGKGFLIELVFRFLGVEMNFGPGEGAGED
jgi:hypothetical protein